jgi:O-antigen/teichoic acid export membrane protein
VSTDVTGPDLAPTSRSVAGDAAALSASAIAQQGSAFGVGIAIRAILGPRSTGVWNLAEVLRQQLVSVSLGTQHAADREMPLRRAADAARQEAEIRSSAYTFLLLEATAVALLFWVGLALFGGSASGDTALALGLVPLLSVATAATAFYQLVLKNRKLFRTLSRLIVVLLAVDWAMVAIAAVAGLQGLLIGLTVGWIARWGVYATSTRRWFHMPLGIRRSVIGPLLRLGVPLSVWSATLQLLQRADALMVAASLGTTSLGLYYLGPQVALTLGALPTAFTSISYPNLLEAYGATGAVAVTRHLDRFVRVVALIVSPLIAAAAAFGVQVLVELFLPEFHRGLRAMQIYGVTALFGGTSLLVAQAMIALRRMRALLVWTAAPVVLEAGALGVLAARGLTLEGAALAAVAGQALLAGFLLARTGDLPHDDGRTLASTWRPVVLVWAILTPVLLGLVYAFPVPDSYGQALGFCAIQLVVAVLAIGALAWALTPDTLREASAIVRRR